MQLYYKRVRDFHFTKIHDLSFQGTHSIDPRREEKEYQYSTVFKSSPFTFLSKLSRFDKRLTIVRIRVSYFVHPFQFPTWNRHPLLPFFFFLSSSLSLSFYRSRSLSLSTNDFKRIGLSGTLCSSCLIFFTSTYTLSAWTLLERYSKIIVCFFSFFWFLSLTLRSKRNYIWIISYINLALDFAHLQSLES